jgi:hypothetical protein
MVHALENMIRGCVHRQAQAADFTHLLFNILTWRSAHTAELHQYRFEARELGLSAMNVDG